MDDGLGMNPNKSSLDFSSTKVEENLLKCFGRVKMKQVVLPLFPGKIGMNNQSPRLRLFGQRCIPFCRYKRDVVRPCVF